MSCFSGATANKCFVVSTESLPPPIYTLMADNGGTAPPTNFVTPTVGRPTLAPPALTPVRPRPASVPSPTSLRSLPPTPPAVSATSAPVRYGMWRRWSRLNEVYF